MVSGVAPDLLAGDGEPEDFIGEDSDFDGLDDFDFWVSLVRRLDSCAG